MKSYFEKFQHSRRLFVQRAHADTTRAFNATRQHTQKKTALDENITKWIF